MGIEAFGISMRFVGAGVFEQLRDTLAACPGIRLEQEEQSEGYVTVIGEYCDGAHFIEFQLARELENQRCTLAARFSLCSHETIDAVFIDIVARILSSLDADIWLMTSALGQKTNYLPGDTRWLLAALPDEIAEMRKYWQSLFGPKQGAVRVKDSFSFVGATRNV